MISSSTRPSGAGSERPSSRAIVGATSRFRIRSSLVPRLIPVSEGKLKFALVEEVIEANIHRLFPSMHLSKGHLFRVTRDADVEIRDDKAADLLIKFVDERYKGFADLVDFYEISTPITTEYMTSHDQGSIYGLASVPERFDTSASPWCQVHTPVKNLYLTGADTTSLGIAGAMMGGVATCAHLMKPWRLPKLLKLV